MGNVSKRPPAEEGLSILDDITQFKEFGIFFSGIET